MNCDKLMTMATTMTIRSTSLRAFAAFGLAAACAAGNAAGDAAGHQHGVHAKGHDHAERQSAIGEPGVAAKATRTVKIDMSDAMRFTPASVKVRQGETVRFLVSNSGKLEHEMVLGTARELSDHHEHMLANPDMKHDDAEPNMVSLAGGKSGEIVWHFTRAGRVLFACLEPGHFEAGMKGAVQVAKAAGKPAAAATGVSK